MQKQITPVEFAAKWQDLELAVSLNYLQEMLVGLLKTNLYQQNCEHLFRALDKCIIAKKALTNNLNKQLVIEDIALEINGD